MPVYYRKRIIEIEEVYTAENDRDAMSGIKMYQEVLEENEECISIEYYRLDDDTEFRRSKLDIVKSGKLTRIER